MRPIDADAITYKYMFKHGGFAEAVEKENIDMMPTVDAIPIEWIEAQIEEAGYSGYDMHAYELATMLEEWKEKERKEE